MARFSSGFMHTERPDEIYFDMSFSCRTFCMEVSPFSESLSCRLSPP